MTLYPRMRHQLTVMTADSTPATSVTPEQALQRLVDGNARFVRGELRFPSVPEEVFAELAKHQKPYATILGCSDSRVPPELIFGAGFGDLFVIRVAGNSLSSDVAGSMQYAASHLHTPLVVVLGHEGCGAVSAALQTRFHGRLQRSRIQVLVDNLLPGLSQVDAESAPEIQMAQAVEANVRYTVASILATPEGQTRLAEGRMRIAGAVYELATGRVRFL